MLGAPLRRGDEKTDVVEKTQDALQPQSEHTKRTPFVICGGLLGGAERDLTVWLSASELVRVLRHEDPQDRAFEAWLYYKPVAKHGGCIALGEPTHG